MVIDLFIDLPFQSTNFADHIIIVRHFKL